MTAAEIHTCHEGPLCPAWEVDADVNGHADCTHGSCAEMMHETCVGCFMDATADVIMERSTQ